MRMKIFWRVLIIKIIVALVVIILLNMFYKRFDLSSFVVGTFTLSYLDSIKDHKVIMEEER